MPKYIFFFLQEYNYSEEMQNTQFIINHIPNWNISCKSSIFIRNLKHVKTENELKFIQEKNQL